MQPQTNRPQKRMKHLAFPLLALLCGLLYGFMAFQANIVHIEYSDVYLPALPQAFDGVKLLFLSDIHIAAPHHIKKMEKLMSRLQTIQPDMLILGGDYSNVRIWKQLTAIKNDARMDALRQTAFGYSHQWLRTLKDFHAPLGKFAVRGNHDIPDDSLADALAEGGVQLLLNDVTSVKKDGATLKLAGVDDYRMGDCRPAKVAAQISEKDCAILLTHNPDVLPQVATIEAKNGGAWADLVLSGHTHGGQVRMGSFVPVLKSDFGTRYLSGWLEELHCFALISNGVGTSTLPLRFNAPAQAHVITLHSGK